MLIQLELFGPKACPICGKQPTRTLWERDRDLHPSLDNIRFICRGPGHILAGEWVESELGENRDSTTLIVRAEKSWNKFLERFKC